MKNTDTTILVISAAAFGVCSLAVIFAPTIVLQAFFGVIDLFIITVILFLLSEIKSKNN